nr:hypothetical protein [Tanacetum cinerariifolium]
MSFSKRPGRNTPQCYTKPLDFLKNWNNRFFWVDERVFPTVVDWRTNAPKDGMPATVTYSVEAVRALDTHRTPIQKQPKMLLCLVGISRRYYLGDEVYPTFLHDNDRGGLIRAPNPTKVKVGSRPRAPHEVPLLTLTANRVIEMDDPATATDSSGVPPTIKRSPLDFSLEAGASDQGTAASEVPPSEDVLAAAAPEPSQVRVAAADPPAATESRQKGPRWDRCKCSPKSLRRDHADPRPSGRSHRGKSLVAIQLGLASTASMPEDAPSGVSIAAAGDPESENASSPAEVGSPGGRQVAMGSQLRLRFEQEAKLLKKSVAQVARRDKRIQARELEIKNLEALLETEADIKKAAEDKSVGLIKELECMRARGEEKLKAAFEEFKRYEDDRVERRKRPGKNTPQCYTKPLDSLKNWNNRFFWVDERVFLTVVDWRTNAPKDGMPAADTYSVEAVRALDTHHMDLFSLIRAPNPTKVKVESRPRAPHEVPLLTLTANRVIKMDDPATTTDSSGVPPTIERSPLDFSLEAGASDQGTAASEVSPSRDVPSAAAPKPSQVGVAAADPPVATESRKRGRDGTNANAPPKSLRRDHVDPRPSGSSHGGKSLAAIQLGLASTASMPEDAPTGVSDPDPLFFAGPSARRSADVAQSSPSIAAAGDPKSENASSPAEVGSASGNGSQLRLRFEQEAKLLKKSVAQVASRDKRIQARELEIKNLEALLETEADMKKAAEDKSAGLIKELEDMRARFSDLQVSHEHLSQQIASLKEQVSGEEKLKAAFEEFKQYEDDRVKRRCAELDARLDALSIDFDEELYPHMLTAIAGRRWVIGHGLRLATMKCGESLDMRQAFTDVVSAGITKGMSEGLRHGSDTGKDAPQCIRDLRPSSSQLTILVYPEVRDPRNPWACKEEILLANAIAANISRVEKKKKCRIVCHTHGVGSAHHARSDGIPVSAPTVVP